MKKIEHKEDAGLNLKIERMRKRIKQIDLSEKTGIPQSRLSFIENGRSAARPDELQKIKQALAAA